LKGTPLVGVLLHLESYLPSCSLEVCCSSNSCSTLIAFLLRYMNYGGENALFIGEVGLDLTHHRGTIILHHATMSHKDPSWYYGDHHGMMRYDLFPKLRRLLQINPIASWYDALPPWYDGFCWKSSFFAFFVFFSSTFV
jgi:hypothetical protein